MAVAISPSESNILNLDLVNVNRYVIIFWANGSVCNLGGWLKGSRYEGSRGEFPVKLSKIVIGKRKRREAISPESGIRNLLALTDRTVYLETIP